MDYFDTFIKITGPIVVAALYAAYRYLDENVYLTYKDQRANPKATRKDKRRK